MGAEKTGTVSGQEIVSAGNRIPISKVLFYALVCLTSVFIFIPHAYGSDGNVEVTGTIKLADSDEGREVLLVAEGGRIFKLESDGDDLDLVSLAGKTAYARGNADCSQDRCTLLLTSLPVILNEPFPSSASSMEGQSPLRLGNMTIQVIGEREQTEGIAPERLKTRIAPDLAEVLSDERIEIQMIRKSGYGNEVSMRGFGQENMKIMLDGGILEGACGSRKDPGLSHIGSLLVSGMKIQQGPFDVTRPGALGGYVDVITRKPAPGFRGEIVGKLGSYDHLSTGFLVEGGNEKLQGLFGYNFSKSGQYEDGNGNALWETREGLGASYSAAGREADAFSKHDFWGKFRYSPSKKHTILLEHSHGEAADILTPRVGFDTDEEVTKLSRISWEARESHALSNKFTLSAYRNRVEHYPFQGFRNVAVPKNNIVQSTITGGSAQNVTSAQAATLTYGLDFYKRSWWGDVYNSLTGQLLNGYLIPSVDSHNLGAYIQSDILMEKWSLSTGFRLDRFQQEAQEELRFTSSVTDENKQVDFLPGGQISASYFLSGNAEIFAGIGRSYRPPTSTERYIQGNPSFFGNPQLKPAANTEFDTGFRMEQGLLALQLKGFYSTIDNYIYQEKTEGGRRSFTNIDAHIYGGDVTAEISLPRSLILEAGASFQRGVKDTFPENNQDRDLGQIAPLRSRVALRYQTDLESLRQGLFGTIEWVHSEPDRHVDIAAGEKQIAGWDTINFLLGYSWKSITLSLGGENIFDKYYAVANSYEWDVIGGTGANPAIVHEPGRTVYASLDWQF